MDLKSAGKLTKRIAKKALIVLVFAYGIVLAWAVNYQERVLFPSAHLQTVLAEGRHNATFSCQVPKNSELFHFITSDKELVEVWRAVATVQGPLSGKVVVFHRGNGGELTVFADYQRFFNDLGATIYLYNYRNYGASTGALTEKDLLADSKALTDEILQREKISPDQLILVGYSMGSGIAASTASQVQPSLLILFAGYSSMPETVIERPVIGQLLRLITPFLRWNLNTAKAVSTLKATDLILVHGERDQVIGIDNSRRIKRAYGGSGQVVEIYSAEAGHYILSYTQKRLTEALKEWSARQQSVQ